MRLTGAITQEASLKVATLKIKFLFLGCPLLDEHDIFNSILDVKELQILSEIARFDLGHIQKVLNHEQHHCC